jgi:hypothetical protein
MRRLRIETQMNENVSRKGAERSEQNLGDLS